MSKYTDIEFLDYEKNILLVRDNETGETYVKKYISDKQKKIYDHIQTHGYKGVPKVIDIYPEQDYYILIEEYIKGQSLQKMLDEGFVFKSEYILKLVIFFINTLSPIHRDGLVHRDITPANIMRCGDEHYLVDFGISRFYDEDKGADTELLGTHSYAAPEQFGFGQSTERTDIYAIGKVVDMLLFGNHKPEEVDIRTFLKQILPGLPFLSFINRCTKMDPEKRYESVKKLFWPALRAICWPFLSTPFFIFYALAILILVA